MPFLWAGLRATRPEANVEVPPYEVQAEICQVPEEILAAAEEIADASDVIGLGHCGGFDLDLTTKFALARPSWPLGSASGHGRGREAGRRAAATIAIEPPDQTV
jgi:hypothetical protein